MSDALFATPDLRQLQRSWPRLALRGAALFAIPLLVALLAGALDLFAVIRSIPLPLDVLATGPFPYEGKVVAAIAATVLGVGYLLPKRASSIALVVSVGGVLWTGHVFISLQWARLFAPGIDLRRDAMPGADAWAYGALLLAAGVACALLETLLDTRAHQRERGLAVEETDAVLVVQRRALARALAAAAGIAAALALAFAALQAILGGVRLPFRLNPVLVLFAMGIGLAVVVAFAARRGSPVDP